LIFGFRLKIATSDFYSDTNRVACTVQFSVYWWTIGHSRDIKNMAVFFYDMTAAVLVAW